MLRPYVNTWSAVGAEHAPPFFVTNEETSTVHTSANAIINSNTAADALSGGVRQRHDHPCR